MPLKLFKKIQRWIGKVKSREISSVEVRNKKEAIKVSKMSAPQQKKKSLVMKTIKIEFSSVDNDGEVKKWVETREAEVEIELGEDELSLSSSGSIKVEEFEMISRENSSGSVKEGLEKIRSNATKFPNEIRSLNAETVCQACGASVKNNTLLSPDNRCISCLPMVISFYERGIAVRTEWKKETINHCKHCCEGPVWTNSEKKGLYCQHCWVVDIYGKLFPNRKIPSDLVDYYQELIEITGRFNSQIKDHGEEICQLIRTFSTKETKEKFRDVLSKNSVRLDFKFREGEGM